MISSEAERLRGVIPRHEEVAKECTGVVDGRYENKNSATLGL